MDAVTIATVVTQLPGPLFVLYEATTVARYDHHCWDSARHPIPITGKSNPTTAKNDRRHIQQNSHHIRHRYNFCEKLELEEDKETLDCDTATYASSFNI